MKANQIPAGQVTGIHVDPAIDSENNDALAAICRDILHTREARRLMTTVFPEFLNVWAGTSRWKKNVSKLARHVVNDQISGPGNGSGKNEIQLLFEDHIFLTNLAEQMPELVSILLDALCACGRKLETLPVDEKTRMLADLLAGADQGRTGALLTSGARMLNDIHNNDPEFLANTLGPGIERWLESTDFGEFKESVENFSIDILALVEKANDAFWQYPAKMVLLFSFMPNLINLVAGSLKISIEKLNAVPPDLLTDIVISLLNEINGDALAGTLDELTEVLRKIHTGSALLGEPGSPQLPKTLFTKIDEIVSQIDPETLWKAGIALAEIKASFQQALSEAVSSRPEHFRLNQIKKPELYNIRVREKNRQLSLWDNVDDEEFVDIFGSRLNAYDAQEIGELLNNLLRLLNRLGEEKPDIEAGLVRNIVNAVDEDELALAARRFFSDAGEEIKPLARAVVPGLVEWVCGVLSPDDDEYEDDAARARRALKALFKVEEA